MATKGKIVWYELMSNDAAAAEKFYTAMFGWKVTKHDMGPMGTYTIFSMGERQFGGMVAQDKGKGVPSHWMNYINVPDVDATVKQATGLKAQVFAGPMDIPDVGRFAVLADPQGGVFAPYKSKSDEEAPAFKPVPGDFCWSEVMGPDPKALVAFYETVFGYGHKMFPMPEGEYFIFTLNGADAAGCMAQPPGTGDRGYWISYIAAAQCDAAADKVKSLGGNVMAPPFDVPGVGRIAIVSDPSGAVFGLFQDANK